MVSDKRIRKGWVTKTYQKETQGWLLELLGKAP